MTPQSEILGRNFNNWMLLILAVLNMIVGLFKLSYWGYFSYFAAGMCFMGWLYSRLINNNFRLIDRLFKMNERLLDTQKCLSLTSEKRKGGKIK